MYRSRFLLLPILLFLSLAVSGQTPREQIYENPYRSGGVYYAYPAVEGNYTAPPKGYKPFYISHYGRHGSRWLLTDKQYTAVMEVFDKAAGDGALTELGKDVYERVKIIYADGIKRAGELSPLGYRQHREIAGRMYASFPEVMHGARTISASSTVVPRCLMSMTAFCEQLKGLNPKLDITYETGARSMRYLNFFSRDTNPDLGNEYLDWVYSKDAAWRGWEKDYLQRTVDTSRLSRALFHEGYLTDKQASEIVLGLFNYASNLQNTELGISLYDIFDKEELYHLWTRENLHYYAQRGTFPGNKGYPQYYSIPLLEKVIEDAGRAVANNGNDADLRFAHDGNIMAFVGLLMLDGCYAAEEDYMKFGEAWQSFNITPMAANIQWIFYRNPKSQDILVKIMLNEKETTVPLESDLSPYYRWDDLKKFWEDKIVELKATLD